MNHTLSFYLKMNTEPASIIKNFYDISIGLFLAHIVPCVSTYFEHFPIL